jgi:predicted esterase
MDAVTPPPPSDAGKPPDGKIPTPVGTCPEFAAGMVTFNPAQGPRTAQIFMTDAAKTLHGPFIFYWYATGGSTSQTSTAFGTSLAAIQAAGGIVIAPVHTNAGTFPWISGDVNLEYLFADEMLGCAVQKVGIDTGHIHSLGFSAGALMTTGFGFARSNYLASVATYSGGMQGTGAYQDANNKFAALIFYGGTGDTYGGFSFENASTQWNTKLKADGHFALLCNHGGGHSIPSSYKTSAWTFFQAHGYGVNPSPWAGGLPATGFDICTP